MQKVCSLNSFVDLIIEDDSRTKNSNNKKVEHAIIFLPLQRFKFSDKGDIEFTVSESWVEHWIIKELPTDSEK